MATKKECDCNCDKKAKAALETLATLQANYQFTADEDLLIARAIDQVKEVGC